MSWFSHVINHAANQVKGEVKKTTNLTEQAFSAKTYSSFSNFKNFAGHGGLFFADPFSAFITRNTSKQTQVVANRITALKKPLNVALSARTYSTFQGMVKEVSKNPVAQAVVFTASGGAIDPSMITTAANAYQTKKVLKFTSDRNPAIKNAVNYYQKHAGDYIQKGINHVANEISCDPATGAGITTGVATVGGAVASVYGSPAAGAAVATGAQIGLSKTFQAGYKTCPNLQAIQNASNALSSNVSGTTKKSKNYGWLFVTIPVVGSVFI